MANSFDQTALETISLLELRLRRIEFVISGDINQTSSLRGQSLTISERLAALENSLQQLTTSSKAIQNLLNLHSMHPELFQSTFTDAEQIISDPTSMLSIIMASASMYSETASRLNSVADVLPPSADLSAKLIEQQPYISQIDIIQSNQLEQIMKLRARSAILLERWYTLNILQAGDAWAELSARLRRVEQTLKRALHAKQKDAIFSEP